MKNRYPSKTKILLLVLFLFSVVINSSAQIINNESFDATTFPPTGWQNIQISGTGLWNRVTNGTNPTQSPHSGAGQARYNDYSFSPGTTAHLITPVIDYANLGSDTAQMSFWMYRDNAWPTYHDTLRIYVNTAANITGAALLGIVPRLSNEAPTVASNGWYQYSYSIPTTYNTSTNYIIFSAKSGNGNNMFIDDIMWESFLPNCTVPPTGGTTISNASLVCPTTNINLSLSGSSPVSVGLTYQWESSADSIIWSPISGATNLTYSTTQSTTTYYRCALTCSGNTQTSTGVKVTSNSTLACFCASTATNTIRQDVGKFVFGTFTNGNDTVSLNNSASIHTYSNFDSLTTMSAHQGQYVPISISQINSGAFNAAWANVFIDFNQNGVFDATERVFNAGPTAAVSTVSGTVHIPLDALLGVTKLRVVLTGGGSSTSPACGSYAYGETEDYLINITSLPSSIFPGCVNLLAPANNDSNIMRNSSLSFTADSFTLGYIVYIDTLNPPTLAVDTVYGAPLLYAPAPMAGNKTYYWQIVPFNANGNASGCPVWSFTTGNLFTPCTSYATSSTDEDIGNFTFGSLNNGNALPVLSNTNATHTYSNFDNLPPTPVYQGQAVSLSVSQIESGSVFYACWVNVFIDYNQDGDFTDSGERVYTASTATTATTISGTVNIPGTAPLGLTRARVMLTWNGTSTQPPCGTYGYGETEDYIIEITAAPTGPPSCINPVDPVDLATNVILNSSLSWQADPIATGYKVYFGTSITPPFVDSVTTNSFIPPVMNPNTVYYWQIVPYNAFGNASSCPVFSFTTGTLWNYCNSGSASTSGSDIGNVTFGSLNNGVATPVLSNPLANRSYSKFDTLSTIPQIYQGQSTAISVSEITSSASFISGWVNVFIDYNQNGVFTDIGEAVFNSAITSSTNPVTGSIMIPATAPLGLSTMRVILTDAGSASQSPCGIFSANGETEDYIINIAVPPPSPPNCVSAVAPLNAATGVFLNSSLSWASEPTAIDYLLYFDTVSTPSLVDTIAFTNYTPSTMLPNKTYYWKIVPRNANGEAVGCVIWSFTTGTLFLPCLSYPTNASDEDIGNFTFGSINNGSATPILGNTSSVNAYSNFDTLPTTSVFIGQSVPISVSQIESGTTFYACWVNVFVDYNKDGDFTDAGERVFTVATSALNTTVAGTVNIPLTASLGLTRVRAILTYNGNSSQSPCGAYGYGETEDYLLLITTPPTTPPNCVNPVSPVDSATNVILNSTLQWSPDPIATGYKIYFGTSSTPPLVDTASATSFTPPVMSANTVYFWKIVPMNVNGDASGCPTWSFTTGSTLNYCISTSQYTFYGNIGNVTLAALNNGIASPLLNNSSATNLYTSFTADSSVSVPDLIVGGSYPFSVTHIQNDTIADPAWVNVFIDMNQDGIFDPLTEKVYNGSVSSVSSISSGTLVVSYSALIGHTTMRVILTGYGSSTQAPCGFYYSGETEDYIVNILPPPPIDMQPTALFSPTTAGCNSASTPVVATILNTGSNALDFSLNNTTVTAIVSGATSQTINVTITTNTLNGGVPLAPLSSLNIVVGTINMTTQGVYNFKLATTVSGDGNLFNDTLNNLSVMVSSGNASASLTNICNGNSTVLSLTGNSGTIQWQSLNGGTWINETGTGNTSGTYTISPTVNTDYRALVCGVLISDTVSVTVTTVTVPTGTMGDTICGSDTAILSATGTWLRWYSSATGGTLLDTGSTYSPIVGTTTTYYVASSTAGAGSVGKPNNTGSGAQQTSTAYLIFDVFASSTLHGVYVYPGAAGNVVLDLRNNLGSLISSVTVPVTAANIGTATYIPLGFQLTPGSNFRLAQGTGSVSMFRNDAGVSFPYTLPGVLSITNSSAGASYYYFSYNWQVFAGCESTRLPVVAFVDPSLNVTVDIGADTTICSDASLLLDAGSGFVSYDWYNGALSQTVTVNGAGTYYVNVSNSAGCEGNDTIQVSTFPPVIVGLGNDTIICFTCTMTLNAGTFNDYQWQDGSLLQTYNVPPDSNTATYYVTVVDANGCSGSDTIVISRSVGIEEVTAINSLLIQPNPSNGLFSIVNTGSKLQHAVIEIRNTEGQLVLKKQLNELMNGAKVEINLTTFAKGVYSVHLNSKEGSYIKRIVLQ